MRWLLPAFLLACAEPVCDDMVAGDHGLVVTRAEHGVAWGEARCDSCHLRAALHGRSCTPDVDLAEVRARVEAADGAGVCMDCHGTNGVAP